MVTGSFDAVQMPTLTSACRHRSQFILRASLTKLLRTHELSRNTRFGELHAITRDDVAAETWPPGVTSLKLTPVDRRRRYVKRLAN